MKRLCDQYAYLTDTCLPLVHRQLQLSHDRAHMLQSLFRLAAFAQNH
jgi:hypothetical protein